MDYKTATNEEIKTAVLEDGVIDADEAAALKERLYDDGVIDQEKADLLFKLNDAVSGNANDPAWQELFVDAITDFVLADDTSPGEVDEDEAIYLIKHIIAIGQVDEIEKALLLNIGAKATKIHSSLQYKIDMIKA